MLRLCLDPEDTHSVILEAHVTTRGDHASRDQMANCILYNGYWWPNLTKNVADYIQQCPNCIQKEPISHATLYLMMAALHWANYIVSYLKGKDLDLPKHRLRAIAQETQDYTLVGEQVYKQGKDQVLRLCVPKEKYIPILEHANACIAKEHFLANITDKKIMWLGL